MKNKPQKIIYIVHAVDAEGPLFEDIKDTFKRIEEIFNIKLSLKPSKKNLKKLQNKQINLPNKLKNEIAKVIDEHLLNYNTNWEQIDKMLYEIMSPGFRKRYPDSFGGGWIYNWHCVDHVGYTYNPRKRDMGIHNIFDHYKNIILKTRSKQDAIHWHFHPMPFSKEAHKSSTSYINSPHLYDILTRRIIERNWFPVVNRAGFHAERPDSHWFLEQWIPFDLSNISIDTSRKTQQKDWRNGRFGDWRLAPSDWSIYQPHHDNYQLKGNCRRWIGRILNLKTRTHNINLKEIEKAFKRANSGLPTIMGITSHDFRDMKKEIEEFRNMFKIIAAKYPEVKFKYSEAAQAFREVIYGPNYNFDKIKLSIKTKKINNNTLLLKIKTIRGKIFGPQPFLAIKTKSGNFFYDNLDFDVSLSKWSYTFDTHNIMPQNIDIIGIATNDKYGFQYIKNIKL